jgi:hypothetical protein
LLSTGGIEGVDGNARVEQNYYTKSIENKAIMSYRRYQAKLIFLEASRHAIKFNGAKLLKKPDINYVNSIF